MRIEAIARIVHATDRAFCEEIGDLKPHWDEMDASSQRASIEGVRAIEANPDSCPATLHEAWCRRMAGEGWRWGEVRDERAGTHPFMVPFDELPLVQQCRDTLLIQVARVLLSGNRDD